MTTESVLISPAELAELLASERPPILADVRWSLGGPPGRPDFEASHIPGAVWVDLEAQLASPPGAGGRHPLPRIDVFQRAMRDIGVCEDSLVVAYDAATSQAAARLWWLLSDAGHHQVRVLNGGLAAWIAAGLPTTSGPGVPSIQGDFVAHPGQRTQLNAVEIASKLGTSDGLMLVDVRAPERYSGDKEPIDPIAGHIPGAINLPATANLDVDGRFLPPAEIAARYAAAGGVEGAVLYCGSGVTAAQSLLALESAGVAAAIYPGSWSDWITDPTRPIATDAEP
ncbi:MAG TPA: sulfurtransferase [Propionibacteriaceae bacterium]|nr:sulfurtransferase [Propionibacteriaceae bacterium]